MQEGTSIKVNTGTNFFRCLTYILWGLTLVICGKQILNLNSAWKIAFSIKHNVLNHFCHFCLDMKLMFVKASSWNSGCWLLFLIGVIYLPTLVTTCQYFTSSEFEFCLKNNMLYIVLKWEFLIWYRTTFCTKLYITFVDERFLLKTSFLAVQQSSIGDIVSDERDPNTKKLLSPKPHISDSNVVW